MDPRFWLRFETGERSGERVPVPAGGLTVGRNPDNALVLTSPSVSGQHAKLSVADEDVVLRDLGSTNGTRVGAERVESRLLRHGDTVRLGNVVLTFLDGERADVPAASRAHEPSAPPADRGGDAEGDEPLLEGFDGDEDELDLEPAPEGRAGDDLTRTVLAQEATESPAAAGEAVGRIAAERLARAAPRSALAGLALLVLAAGGTALILWRGRGGGPRAERGTPVVVDPANLLGAGSSFEDELVGWTANEAAPAAFDRGAAWRASGRSGLGVHLEPGAWAESVSSEVIAPAVAAGRGALRVSAAASAEGAATLRLGLELSSSRARGRSLVAWSEPLRDGGGTLEVAAGPIPGCDRARVLVQAFAAGDGPDAAGAADAEPPAAADEPREPVGAAGIDDVALVASDAPVEPLRFEEYELHGLGAGAAALARIDRVLAWDLAFRPAGARGDAAERFATRGPAATVRPGSGFELRPEPGAPPGAFAFRVDGELAGAGVATLGHGGRRAHPVAFEVEEATEVLVGSGLDLLRFRLGAPCRVVGREQDGALAVVCTGELGASGAIVLQVAFREERARALRLADEARAAERAGDLGGSLARWGELLDTLPFDEPLVGEAASTRARLIQAGLERVQALRAETERARFFDLADLHREVRGEALALARRYRGSEVEEAVAGLVADIEAELARLEAGRSERETEVLTRVAEALEQRGAEELARHVASELGAPESAAAGASTGEPVGAPDGAPSGEER